MEHCVLFHKFESGRFVGAFLVSVFISEIFLKINPCGHSNQGNCDTTVNTGKTFRLKNLSRFGKQAPGAQRVK